MNGKAPKDEGAQVQGQKRKVIRMEAEEVSCPPRSAFHEDVCFGVTISAVTTPSDSSSLLRLLSMRRSHTRSICVSSVVTKDSRQRAWRR